MCVVLRAEYKKKHTHTYTHTGTYIYVVLGIKIYYYPPKINYWFDIEFLYVIHFSEKYSALEYDVKII